MTGVQAARGKSTGAAKGLVKARPPVPALAGLNLRVRETMVRYLAQTQFPSGVLLLCRFLSTALLCSPREIMGLSEKREVLQAVSLQGGKILQLICLVLQDRREQGKKTVTKTK